MKYLTYMIIGVGAGAGIGILNHNLPIGAGIGAVVGLVLGTAVSSAKRKTPDA